MAGYPSRALIGAAVAAVLGLLGAMGAYNRIVPTNKAYPDYYKVAMQHRRFAGVIAVIPPGAVIGYITDQPFEQSNVGEVNFFGAQYALAPRLLVEEDTGRRHEWVVGSYLRRPDIAIIEQKYDLLLVQEMGLGVYLFRRTN
jgi:hypothetical protein